MCSQPTGSSPALARWSSRRRAILRRFSFLQPIFSSFCHTWEGEATSDSEIISPLKIFVITWSPPDCGDQLSATRFECGSNGLKTRGYRHLGWDFSLPVFLLMIRFSRDGVGIHQTQSLQWVGRKNKILFQQIPNQFCQRWASSLAATSSWPTRRQRTRRGKSATYEFSFFIQCHLKISFLLLGTNNSRIHKSSSHLASH